MPCCVIALAGLFLLPDQVVWYPPQCHPLSWIMLPYLVHHPSPSRTPCIPPVPSHEELLSLLHCPSLSFLKNHYPYMEVLQSDKLSTIPDSNEITARQLQTKLWLLLFVPHEVLHSSTESRGFCRNWRCQTGPDPVLTSGCTLVMSGLQINFTPLITTLWDQLFIQFLT